ncbi:hypothetical protein LMG22037_05844 [Paraburkholderia phenoliruptrix]|uniref:Uncharacterized protein n=1 Tax=Paraburkholderia phenoliruptrix TaxID=252970 RepID=A0A6J5CEC4_9BURK|nr:hypothetical protein LMG22037_05844 [Paraburkholderia phenoliruptrix]
MTTVWVGDVDHLRLGCFYFYFQNASTFASLHDYTPKLKKRTALLRKLKEVFRRERVSSRAPREQLSPFGRSDPPKTLYQRTPRLGICIHTSKNFVRIELTDLPQRQRGHRPCLISRQPAQANARLTLR